MAIVRCNKHKPKGRAMPYVQPAESVGFPDTATVCGRINCNEPGLIWLTAEENEDWMHGVTVFSLRTHTAKVRAKPYSG